MLSLYGFQVVTDPNMVDRVWVFPKERFVEYEPKDEGWCRKLGIGHEEVRPKPEVVRVGRTLVMHPQTWERLCEFGRAEIVPTDKGVVEVRMRSVERQCVERAIEAADRRFSEVVAKALPEGRAGEATCGGLTKDVVFEAMKSLPKVKRDVLSSPLLLTVPTPFESQDQPRVNYVGKYAYDTPKYGGFLSATV